MSKDFTYAIEYTDKIGECLKHFDELNPFVEYLLSLNRTTNKNVKLFKINSNNQKESLFEWNVLRDYIEANVATHIDLTTHIDTLRAYAIKCIYDGAFA